MEIEFCAFRDDPVLTENAAQLSDGAFYRARQKMYGFRHDGSLGKSR